MDFLKKHYEKMILAFFLLIFVFLLFYLIDLSKSTNTITKKDLQIPAPDPNYVKNDFSHKKYQINYIFNKDCVWDKSTVRSDKDNIYSDLLIPYKCARCPFCEKVIPCDYFYGSLDNPRHCPLCNKPLPRPFKDPDDTTIIKDGGSLDRDNDGIPNVTEIKLGLDPDNPDDALYDMDGDGFPNVFEYKEGTNIQNAKSHPEMYKRLQLLEFRETLLPYKLKTVVTNNKKEAREWDVQINELQEDGKIKTRFKYLGSSLEMDKTNYKIVKIEPDYQEERRGGTIVKTDRSKIMFESYDGKYKITMQVDKDVYSPKPKAVIEDLANGKQYHVGSGDDIVMHVKYKSAKGRDKTETVKYNVVKVDRKGKQVIIEFKDKKSRKVKQYSITAKALMPRIKQKVEERQLNEEPGRVAPGSLEAPPGEAPANISSRKKKSRKF
ncbi:MAG: hypothetical protein PHV82_01585 [Victivallaceae bacterium]|nr:hypothetical protein [Victivallaceae bacterium]